ncbi:MAG: TerC family protein [Byssovorax sp.]
MSTPLEGVGTPALWAGFLAFVLAMLVVDLGVFHRKTHAVTLKEAGVWSVVWVTLALVFNAGVYVLFGPERALSFTAGYVIEKALAVDNIFVFAVIFAHFAIPAAHQHRVLFWGVLGALGMRAAFILAGGAFLDAFHWATYVFGAVLAFTGVKLMLQRNEEHDPGKSPVVRALRRVLPVSGELEGERFFVTRSGRRLVTPLFLALIVIEVSDVVFAVDSVPAIFAVTRDPFIVFTSNVFAILGLRAMYFLLAGVIQKFHLLKVGLSAVLIFVGAKMLLFDVVKIPIAASLGVIAAILGGSIALSLLRPRPAPAVSAS